MFIKKEEDLQSNNDMLRIYRFINPLFTHFFGIHLTSFDRHDSWISYLCHDVGLIQ